MAKLTRLLMEAPSSDERQKRRRNQQPRANDFRASIRTQTRNHRTRHGNSKLEHLDHAGQDSATRVPPLASRLSLADRPRGFAAAARERANFSLLRCEERYPNDGAHSVLYVVVDDDAAHWRETLRALHEEYFGPGKSDPLAPVRLEVIDRSTDEALQRLIDAGLLAKTTRATRPLWPAEASESSPPPLSAAELERSAGHRQRAARKVKIARVLNDAGLGEEARSALLEAMFPLGCALAVEQRLPEPASLNDALLPPLAAAWKEALPIVREFAWDNARPCSPVLEALKTLA